MTFAEPILLAGFILIPLAMLAYGSLQRRRRRESAAWANPALLPNLSHRAARLAARTCRRCCCCSRWRVLVFALARPQRTVAAPQRAANIVMVTDISGSMNATDVAAGPSHRGRRRRQDAHRQGPGDVPARAGHVLRLRRAARRPDHRPLPDEGRAGPAGGRGRHRDGRRTRARAVVRANTRPERERHRRAPPPVRDRPALRRQEHLRHARPGRRRPRGRPREDPDLRDRPRHRPTARSNCATRSASSSASRSHRTPRRSRRSRASAAASPTPPPRPTSSRRSTPTSAPASPHAPKSGKSRPSSPAARSHS